MSDEESSAKAASKIYGSHPPLDSLKQEIRLLSLHDSDDANNLLVGELHVTTLDHDYTALPYVWGDENNRRSIGLNDIDTTITTNLAIILRRLRAEKKGLNIWVDAICINQTDNAEKSHQVQMMSEIYRHANIQTIMWLGEEETRSDEAMKLVSNANQTLFDEYDPKNRSPVWQLLGQLLNRDWWKRMWVVQETMLSPNPIVKCGAEEVPFEQFIVFRNLRWYSEEADKERFRPLRNLYKYCPFARMMEFQWRSWVGGELGLWLLDVALFQCLHLRDKVYALLGLIRKDLKGKITVEYDSRVERQIRQNCLP